MKKQKKIKLKYGKERVLFSDVLPYETPLTFSNRYLYRFISKYKFHIDEERDDKGKLFITVKPEKEINVDEHNFARLLFGLSNDKGLKSNSVFYPFQFNIAHKIGKSRILTVIHPLNQLQIVDFYEKYKYAILYLCSKSNFSLRKPVKVAQYFYYRDKLHANLLGKKRESVELYFNEYENLKSYFSYQKYSNIYKFYEDYRYQRAEKKFKYLVKFDLQSCFDSIYTHSISWAVGGGRDNVKLLPGYKGNWLGDAFDEMMQSLNARETNGIVIGPEFSRIFAEIILQNIDERVENELRRRKIINKVNYECYRYVDDYFLFYNDKKEEQLILECFSKWLSEYKLCISPSKTVEYDRPFVTNVTKAKLRINKLVQSIGKQKIWEHDDINLPIDDTLEDVDDVSNSTIDPKEEVIPNVDLDKIISSKLSLYVDPNNTIAEFKSIISETAVSYNDVANYTLEILGRKIDRLLTKFDVGYKTLSCAKIVNVADKDTVQNKRKSAQKQIVSYLNGVIDIAFFIYNANRQINTTLKLQKLLNSIVIYVRSDYKQQKDKHIRFDDYFRNNILKKVQDELCLILKTAGKYSNAMHESIYLLVLAKSLGTRYLFTEDILKQYINNTGIKYNMFVCQVLLYYYGNHNIYKDLKKELFYKILDIYKSVPTTERNRNAELSIMTSDFMTCPFLCKSNKILLLKEMGIEDPKIQESIINFAEQNRYIFTKWTKFDLNKELQAKISQEVYS